MVSGYKEVQQSFNSGNNFLHSNIGLCIALRALRWIRLYDKKTVVVNTHPQWLKKGYVKCQFGMVVCVKGNEQAVENELPELKGILRKVVFQQKPYLVKQNVEIPEVTGEKLKPEF